MTQDSRYNGFVLHAYGQPLGEGKFFPTVVISRSRVPNAKARTFEVPGSRECDSELEASHIAAKYGMRIVDGNVRGVDPWQYV